MSDTGAMTDTATARESAAPHHPRAPDRDTQIRLAEIATAYYLGGQSKVEIARNFAISRFQVAKLLADALESGIVSIHIRDPRTPTTDLDVRLAAALGIDRVRIADWRKDEPVRNADRLGTAAMDEFKNLVRPRTTIGISWSRSLDLASRFLPDLPPCDIVQLAGALDASGSGFLPRVVAQQVENASLRAFPIYAPLVVDEEATALDLKRQPAIAEALERADHLDLAVVAVGAWKPGESTVWERVSDSDRAAGVAAGAVAEISGRLIDADGRLVSTGLDDRTIGVRIDQLIAARQVIAVAHGVGRVDAVIAAARGGLVTCLVLDSELARAVLDRFEPPS